MLCSASRTGSGMRAGVQRASSSTCLASCRACSSTVHNQLSRNGQAAQQLSASPHLQPASAGLSGSLAAPQACNSNSNSPQQGCSWAAVRRRVLQQQRQQQSRRRPTPAKAARGGAGAGPDSERAQAAGSTHDNSVQEAASFWGFGLSQACDCRVTSQQPPAEQARWILQLDLGSSSDAAAVCSMLYACVLKF
jgi:hypothetical protein